MFIILNLEEQQSENSLGNSIEKNGDTKFSVLQMIEIQVLKTFSENVERNRDGYAQNHRN